MAGPALRKGYKLIDELLLSWDAKPIVPFFWEKGPAVGGLAAWQSVSTNPVSPVVLRLTPDADATFYRLRLGD